MLSSSRNPRLDSGTRGPYYFPPLQKAPEQILLALALSLLALGLGLRGSLALWLMHPHTLVHKALSGRNYSRLLQEAPEQVLLALALLALALPRKIPLIRGFLLKQLRFHIPDFSLYPDKFVPESMIF